MFLDIHELEREPVVYDGVLPPGRINLGDGLRQLEPLEVHGVAELVGGEIHLRGSLQTAVELECDRCLEPIKHPVRTEFDLFYRPLKSIAHEEEVEVKASELEVGFYQGNGLELEEALKEQILLSLPMKNTCRPDCRGLCPQCKQNRNTSPCHCPQQSGDQRWAALEKFKN